MTDRPVDSATLTVAPTTAPLARLRRSSMESRAVTLMTSSIVTGVLGVAYWVVAGRLYPTAEVGRASATISTATMLSSLACLSLGGSYQRFLPVAGDRTRRLVIGGLLLAGVVAAILGVGFVFFGVGRDELFQHMTERLLFPALVVVLAGYALLDPILTGLRRVRVVALKNVSLSLLKILPLPLLAYAASDLAMTGTWLLLACCVTVVIAGWLFRHGLSASDDVAPTLPPARQIWAFQGASFAMSLVVTLTPLCLPLVVLSQLGPESSAYYNLAAALGTAAGMLRANVIASYVVDASAPGAPQAALTRRMIRLMAAVAGMCAAGLAVGGPILLWLVGGDYLAAATPLVLLLAGETLVAVVTAAYAAVVQVRRRLRLLVAVQAGMVVVTIGGAMLLVPTYGLVGVGLAMVAAQATAAAVVAVPLVREARSLIATGVGGQP
ncbi:oligosaccharide flippase family protein [Solwaraspora sp. WMMD406]|uniref:lipopolysaccharide biosynthesis protein n=1 Tax=Solwaraspora sp. WMMD406 TaxID=3016095 RepID=UPI002415F5EA|nr:oligosaccharide flippase family protein [Solwaraspora sp. WMMD406]MDG4762603.1 oligosaccharide flippase family protein [Solwaraspora sp. WMMD406]